MNVPLLGTAIHDARFRLPTQASDVGWAPWDDAQQSSVLFFLFFWFVCLFFVTKLLHITLLPQFAERKVFHIEKGFILFELEAFDNRRAPYNGHYSSIILSYWTFDEKQKQPP